MDGDVQQIKISALIDQSVIIQTLSVLDDCVFHVIDSGGIVINSKLTSQNCVTVRLVIGG